MTTRRTLLVTLVVVGLLLPTGAAPVGAASDCSFPLSETDNTGTTVTVDAKPDRIATLGPSAAQTLYEIGDWDRVVGVTANADYLPRAGSKTQLGNPYFQPATVTERTIALDPDLVLVPNAYKSSVQVDKLRSAGLTVYVFDDATDLEDVVEKTRLTGDLVGSCESADETADTMETQLDIIEEALRDEPRPKAFYDLGGDYTAGSGTFVDAILTTAGVENVAANNYATLEDGYRYNYPGYYRINKEKLVSVDPEWYVMSDGAFDSAAVPAGPNGELTATTAYREGNGILLDADEMNQPAPHTIDAVLDVVQVVHPEAYREEIGSRIDRSGALGGEKRITSEALADGTARLTAQNLGRQKEVSFAVPPSSDVAEAATLRRVNVSLGTLNPSFTLDVAYQTVDGNGSVADGGPPPLEGTYTFSRFDLSKNGIYDEDVDRLTFEFGVEERRLAAREAAPENVTLYRHNGTAWTALETRVVGRENGTVVFEATSPGASTFAVGVPETEEAAAVTATPTPEPTTEPTTAEPSTTTATAPATTERPTPAPTTETTFPGFGVGAALVAFLLAGRSLGGRRR